MRRLRTVRVDGGFGAGGRPTARPDGSCAASRSVGRRAAVAVWAAVVVFAGLCAATVGRAAPPASSTDAAAASVATTGSAAERAQELLQLAGVRSGVAVVVAEQDAGLAVELARRWTGPLHVLLSVQADVLAVRRRLVRDGLSGQVTVEPWAGGRLPFVDNLVALLVWERSEAVQPREAQRVLRPNGVWLARTDDDGWRKEAKPWPAELDQWSHYLHDPSNNAVAKDERVGPPRHMQWLATPLWSRYHHTLASVSGVVSAGGRLFYIVDEAPSALIQLPPRWFLVARDAFSGVELWRRRIPTWAYHLRKFRSGPVQLPRLLVADARRVFVALGVDAPVTALDAATGQPLRTYDTTQGTEEIVVDGNVLLVVVGRPVTEQAAADPARRGKAPFPNKKTVVAVDVTTGRELWRWSDPEASVVPVTLAASDGRVCFGAGTDVVCLDEQSGRQLWRRTTSDVLVGRARPGGKRRGRRGSSPQAPNIPLGGFYRWRDVGWAVATLVVSDGVVLYADGRRLTALELDTGRELWKTECRPGFRSPADVLVVNGQVWVGPEFDVARDLRTGRVVRSTAEQWRQLRTAGHHHRCYREKATTRFLLSGYRGVELFDLRDQAFSRNNWVRGLCQYGVMPCNGLLYAPPHACGCFMEAKIRGFWALASSRSDEAAEPGEEQAGSGRAARLVRGPAWSDVARQSKASTQSDAEQWPTLRHDPLRSGSTEMNLPARLAQRWTALVGGRLSAPVVADGLLLTASVDSHRVVALDARTGEQRWEFVAGGRVDSPPTVYDGLALFGSADGSVYCLRLQDGQLVWRFRAAPQDRRTVAVDQLESVWPVRGSVLVLDGVAYVAAGRSSYLDGGIWVYGLDPRTGRVLYQTRLRDQSPGLIPPPAEDRYAEKIDQNKTDYKTFLAPDRSDAFSMKGATNDVLVSDGFSVYLRTVRFDRQLRVQSTRGRHLFSTSDLLDDAENHRSHWVLGTGDFSRLPVAYSWIANRPSGRGGCYLARPAGLMLCFDQQTVWGVRRVYNKAGYTLFAETNRPFSPDEQPERDFQMARRGRRPPFWSWSVDLPLHPRAMLRAGEVLVLAGTPLPSDPKADPEELAACFEGKRGGRLLVASAKDGRPLNEQELTAPPVWDGLAAAYGQLFLTTTDGQVVCLAGEGP